MHDRYLRQRQQRPLASHAILGHTIILNQKTGKEELAPIDRATTDAERARYGIPPLGELLERHPEAAPPKQVRR